MTIHTKQSGFTLIEMLVAVAIIAVLSSVVYASLGTSRMASRDEARKSDLKSLQLAVELYKAQYGVYPDQGCGTPGSDWAGHAPATASWSASCSEYIVGLVPAFIGALPIDPYYTTTNNTGYYYLTNSTKTGYKIIAHGSPEVKLVTSYKDEFARCPAQCSGGSCECTTASPQEYVYAVYNSVGQDW